MPEICETLGPEFPAELLIAGLGYKAEFKELRASDHNTPTIRKRLFMVARRDGLPIVWPEQTHAAPDHPAVKAGKMRPYRTAAECIDWSLPCPSIFSRKKPLADATLRRIAKGIMRYVVNSAAPFIVGQGGPIYAGKPVSAEQPMGTLTTENHWAIVVPSIVPVTHQGGDHEKPLGTVVGSNKAALVTAFLNEHANASSQRVMPVDQPLRTQCAEVKGGHFSMVSAALVGVGGRAGDSRPRGMDEPTATTTSKYDVALATAFLAKHYTGVVGSDLEDPIGTITASDHHSLVTAHIQRDMGKSTGHAADAPLGTVMAGGGGKSALVSSHLVKLRGTSSTASMDEPLHTVSAQGQHHAEVRAFLMKYYSTDQDPRMEEPLHTITTKHRFGLVTIHGQDYEIVDIGLRMLAPHDLPGAGLPRPLRY